MSLAALALRQITRRALEGRTIAEARVRDSELVPLDTLAGQGADGEAGTQPFISLYVDEGSADVSGRGWFSADTTVHLVLELAIASPTTVAAPAGSGPDAVSVDIPETSAGLEASLDILTYQIKAALTTPSSPWADLWGGLVDTIKMVEVFRGAEFRKTGGRFAARQIVLQLGLIYDPVPGEPPADLWADIVAAFAADPELDDLAKALTAVIQGEPAPSWVRDAGGLGDTRTEARDLGYGAFDSDPEAEPQSMDEATLDDLTPGAEPASFTLVDGEPSSFGV